jgi:hypothetical protein
MDDSHPMNRSGIALIAVVGGSSPTGQRYLNSVALFIKFAHHAGLGKDAIHLFAAELTYVEAGFHAFPDSKMSFTIPYEWNTSMSAEELRMYATWHTNEADSIVFAGLIKELSTRFASLCWIYLGPGTRGSFAFPIWVKTLSLG